jgi:prepilin-type N-terminal cleavage/methylation domain-containing protein
LIIPGGYTLIELIVTLGILAIVAGIAYPMFQRYAINGNLKTAVRDLAADFAQLKERAISGDAALGGLYMHRISIVGNSYQLQRCNTPGSPCAAWTTIQTKNLSGYANDIFFTAGTAPTIYTFQTRGTVTNGQIELTNSRGSTGRIIINFSGRTRVEFTIQ